MQVVNKIYEQKLWGQAVNKSWTKVGNKRCEQKLLLKVMNKSVKTTFQQKLGTKDVKLWTKVEKKLETPQ